MIRVFSPNDNRLDIFTAYIADEYGNILLKDTYEKQKEDTYEKADSSSGSSSK